ncbi:MAG: hypothetical protein OEZ36_09395 [Spirochaetota bacterium]|nr:hypothetical protein [Spirochaetota bacterium]
MSEKVHYLSAAGAIALAKIGFMDGSVPSWLRSKRDYYLLTDEEEQALKRLLPE